MRKLLLLFVVLGLVTGCKTNKCERDADGYCISEDEGDKMKSSKYAEEVREVNVPEKVYFAFDKYDLSPQAKKTLDEQVKWMNQDKDAKVLVEGHCDDRGSREYNLALGQKRAEAVKNYLVGKGVSQHRIKTKSYGKERPEVAGSGESVWAKNRRAVTIETR